ncbi:hypothetical protein AA313_de0208968 [Arthrobotrys entomopaga]|nr:hypothetical protein AA313_de0208968 [Arthrobotrys entomopaga]
MGHDGVHRWAGENEPNKNIPYQAPTSMMMPDQGPGQENHHLVGSAHPQNA